MPEPLVSIEAVAERLGVTPRVVKSLVLSRAIPVVKINRRVHRFRLSEVETAVARLTAKPL